MSVLIIAEIGVNHNGSVALARRMVRKAAAIGADAVKFQSFHVERLLVAGTEKAAYQMSTAKKRETQDEMLRRLQLSLASQRELKLCATRAGVEFMSSPFDEQSLRDLVRLRVRRLKIPSGELTNGPLLLAAGRTHLPILLSTGMATLAEVEGALAVIAYGLLRPNAKPTRHTFRKTLESTAAWEALKDKVTLLHCTTQYPTAYPEVNLRAMHTLAAAFGVAIGYSDHTDGTAVAMAAVAMGATVIEKHFTLDRSLPGPDHRASLEPAAFADLVRGVRQVEASLGDGRKRCAASEVGNRAIARKSLVAAIPLQRGNRLSEETMVAKRPGTGRSPMDFWDLVGGRAVRDYDKDEPL